MPTDPPNPYPWPEPTPPSTPHVCAGEFPTFPPGPVPPEPDRPPTWPPGVPDACLERRGTQVQAVIRVGGRRFVVDEWRVSTLGAPMLIVSTGVPDGGGGTVGAVR